MMALTKPQHSLPVHGEYKHLRKYSIVAKQMGIDEDHVIIPAIGQVLETDGESFRLWRRGSIGRSSWSTDWV